MNVQKISNQTNFTAVSIIPRGNVEGRSFSVEKYPSLLDNIPEDKRDSFVKKVVKPASNLKTEICIDCNDPYGIMLQNPVNGSSIILDDEFCTILKNHTVVNYPDKKNPEGIDVKYRSRREAIKKAQAYDTGDPLIDRAIAAVDIARSLEVTV